MEDGRAIPAEEAGEWLREHFEGTPEPKISIEWTVTEPNDLAYAEVLGILFGPAADDAAA